MKVTILNWRKFQPRQDIKNTSWFRLEYRMLEDPDFYNFTHEEFRVWIYILAQACRKNHEQIMINFDHAHATCGLSKSAVVSSIKKLKSLQIITSSALRERYAHDTFTNPTGQYETGRDVTKRNETPPNPHAQQVERLYQSMYPRKVGKTLGLKRLAKEINTPEDVLKLEAAIQNYAQHCLGKDPQYIQHFSTFASSWRDWLEFQAESAPGSTNWDRVFNSEPKKEAQP